MLMLKFSAYLYIATWFLNFTAVELKLYGNYFMLTLYFTMISKKKVNTGSPLDKLLQ